MPSQPIRLQHSLKSNISVRKCEMKFIFCMQININVSYVLILKFLGGLVRHAQPANQIAVFFKVQYLNNCGAIVQWLVAPYLVIAILVRAPPGESLSLPLLQSKNLPWFQVKLVQGCSSQELGVGRTQIELAAQPASVRKSENKQITNNNNNNNK